MELHVVNKEEVITLLATEKAAVEEATKQFAHTAEYINLQMDVLTDCLDTDYCPTDVIWLACNALGIVAGISSELFKCKVDESINKVLAAGGEEDG